MEKLFSADIKGLPTEFVLQRFPDKWFIIITQYSKICNMFTVQYDKEEDLAALVGKFSIPITITSNFGNDTDETRSAIQFLVNQSDLGKSRKELVISLGLKVVDGPHLREIVKYVNKLVEL